MDINAPLIANERAIYSENLLNKEALFDDNTVFNVTSGSGTVTITNEKHYENDKCAKIVWTDIENPLTFYSAGDTYTAEYDGKHIFSWALYVFSNNPTMSPLLLLRIKAYKNGVLYREFTSSCSPAENERYQDNVFQRFGQSLELEQGDVLTWSYECVFGQYLLGTITFYLDGLKLELDDRNLCIPSVYSKPKGKIEPKVYKALLTQSGTDAPTAIILENNLGVTPTYNYIGIGEYSLNTINNYDISKICFNFEPIAGFLVIDKASYEGGNEMNFKTFNDSNVINNNILYYSCIKIEVYP